MPSFLLENHVLRIAEHQSLLFDFLSERSKNWNWGVDLAEGVLTLKDAATSRVLLTCPTFLIGSKSNDDNSFMWGWANSSTTQLPGVTERWDALRAQATTENATDFMPDHAFVLNDEKEDVALAVTAAGALGSFTFYAGGYGGGAAFLAVDSAPDVAARPADVLHKIRIISSQITLLPFNHRAAILAYLGQPAETSGDTLIFDVQGDGLAVTFDEQGRIKDMRTKVGPGNAAPPPQTVPKPGLFKRLFGG